jgi:O-antigen/teichoic acid export membrane protein
VSRSVGFQIKPSAIRLTADIRNLLQNYWWLVLTALLASLSTILNYWFAKQLGPGSVSIWAFGIKLIQIINAISISMFSAVFVPYFSKLVSAGSRQRIRLEVYTILFVGNWGGGLFALIIFGFSNAVVMINFSEIQNNENLHQLVSVIKFGSLQLPLLISGISLLKFSAVSGVSWKVAIATIIGLLVNVVLGFEWLSIWGMLGIAAASCLGTLILTIVIMVTLRNQCFLDWTDLLSVFSIWIIIAFFALAIQLRSEFLAVGAVLLGVLVFLSQIKAFLKDLNFSKSYRV